MRTIIIGAGAMGCFFGGMLAFHGAEVELYDIDQEKVDAINEQGVTVVHQNRECEAGEPLQRKVKVRAVSHIEDAQPAELQLLLVKSYQTERAAREGALIRLTGTRILTMQNGLGNIEDILKCWSGGQVLAGVTYLSVVEVSPGNVCHTGEGLSTVAPLEIENLSAAMETARFFNDHGIEAGSISHFDSISWKKLIVNSAINPLSALHRLENGKLPKNAQTMRDMAALVVEGVAVAQKAGVPLDYGEMWAAVLETCRRSANNRSSMLVDVEKGRRTEIGAINGSIVRFGEAYGVETPLNMQMVRKISALRR
ncbi:MAG: 2-dehydropantoate 2-reductase [Clostridiales bacterium]|nr:2-dehydropantoate 2-reductase [Clostridiales bacterium]